MDTPARSILQWISEKAVTAHFKTQQLQLFGFSRRTTRQYRLLRHGKLGQCRGNVSGGGQYWADTGPMPRLSRLFLTGCFSHHATHIGFRVRSTDLLQVTIIKDVWHATPHIILGNQPSNANIISGLLVYLKVKCIE